MQQDAAPSTCPEKPPDSTGAINRISIPVPPFWLKKPAMWFVQLEGQFALSNITQDTTKFYYVISHLENKYVAEVEDVITNLPPTGCYEKIKAELIRHLSLSEEQRIRQLLMHEEMGDRRPTQFLRHLWTLASLSVLSDFLRTLWTNRLPLNIQVIIAMQGQAALDNVAQLMDKTAITGGILRPFPCRMHQCQRLRVPAEDPHWKASAPTNILACCDIHVHFQGPSHRLTSFYGMVPSSEPSKPCMSAHTGSSTWAIRPIPSRFRALQRQSPLTA
jgi:hypothetical protein